MIVSENKRYNLSEIEVRFKTYLRAGKRLSYNTTKNYLSDLRYFLGWFDTSSGNTSNISLHELVSGINRESVNEYKQFLLNSKVPHQTINRRLSSLRTFLDYCMRVEIVSENAGRAVPNISASTKAVRPSSHFKQEATNTAKEDTNMLMIKTTQPISKALERVSIHKNGPLVLSLVAIMGLLLLFKPSLSQKISIGHATAQASGSNRNIVYQGKLADTAGNPIFTTTNITFSLYGLPVGGKSIYSSGVCKVTPNEQGFISVTLGDQCGNPIDSNILTSSQNLYLGITVGSDNESQPRQQIPNVSMASQAESVSGVKLADASGASAETIPFMNNEGELALAIENPRIVSSNGVMQFAGQAISIITERGSRGNITIAPDLTGATLFTRGNVGIGTAKPSLFKLQVAGDIGPNEDGRYSLGSPQKHFSEIYADRYFLGDTELKSSTISDLWKQSQGAIAPSTVNSDILIGSTATAEANIKLSGTAGGTSFINQGNVGIGTRAPDSILDVAGTVHLRGSTDTKGLFVNSKGFVGIGNTNPSFELDLTGQLKVSGLVMLGDNSGDTVISKATDWQFHHDSSFNLKDDSTNALSIESGLFQIDTKNSRIGIGTTTPSSKLDIVGGNCADTSGDATGCTADYAELYPTSETVKKGEVLAVDKNSAIPLLKRATVADKNAIIGVVSSYPAIIIDGGKLSLVNNEYILDPRRPAVALAGRIPVSIADSSTPIEVGDRLTASSQTGRAEKATTTGMTIGTALEAWEPNSSKDKILTFVNISWYEPSLALSNSGDVNSEEINSPDSPYVYNGLINKVEQKGILPIIDTATREVVGYGGQLAELTVTGSSKLAKASINLLDATIIYAEKLTAQEVVTDKLTAKEAEIMRLRTQSLQAKLIESDSIKTDTFEAKSATISGTLTAKTVDAENIRALQNLIDNSATKNDQEMHALSKSYVSTQELLARFKEEKPTPQFTAQELAYLNLTNNDLTGTAEGSLRSDSLFVYGATTLFDTTVLGNFTAGNISVTNSTILSLSPTLYFSAPEEINFQDGLLKIMADGSIVADGTIIAKGGIQTNEIKSLDGRGLNVILGSEATPESIAQKDSGQARVTDRRKLSIRNSQNEVANIDNTGAASFSTLSLSKDKSQPASSEAQIAASVKTAAAAAGSTTLPAFSRQLTIYNDNISADALIYLTATSSSKNRTLFVSRQESCTQTPGVDETNCSPHFVVEIDDPVSIPISFNWWIIK